MGLRFWPKRKVDQKKKSQKWKRWLRVVSNRAPCPSKASFMHVGLVGLLSLQVVSFIFGGLQSDWYDDQKFFFFFKFFIKKINMKMYKCISGSQPPRTFDADNKQWSNPDMFLWLPLAKASCKILLTMLYYFQKDTRNPYVNTN